LVFGPQISFFLIIWAAIYQKPKESQSKYRFFFKFWIQFGPHKNIYGLQVGRPCFKIKKKLLFHFIWFDLFFMEWSRWTRFQSWVQNFIAKLLTKRISSVLKPSILMKTQQWLKIRQIVSIVLQKSFNISIKWNSIWVSFFIPLHVPFKYIAWWNCDMRNLFLFAHSTISHSSGWLNNREILEFAFILTFLLEWVLKNWKKKQFYAKFSEKFHQIRPFAKKIFIFFLESTIKNKLKSKISEF
jgi:hypothetical protein